MFFKVTTGSWLLHCHPLQSYAGKRHPKNTLKMRNKTMMEKPGPTLHRHLLSSLVRCQIQHSSSLFRAPARIVCPPPPRQFQIQPGLPFSSCFPPILDRSFQHCALPTPMSTTSLWYKQHLLCTLVYIQSIFYAIS